MDINFWFYLLFGAIFSVLVTEGIKRVIKPENKVLKYFLYSVIALIPCTASGIVIANVMGNADIYHIIADSAIVYIIQYIGGQNLISKFKETICRKADEV